jgi:hypothetical protein
MSTNAQKGKKGEYMALLEILPILIAVGLGVFVIFQVIVPVVRGSPAFTMFWRLRSKKKMLSRLENELTEAQLEQKFLEYEQKLQEIRKNHARTVYKIAKQGSDLLENESWLDEENPNADKKGKIKQ